MLHDIPRQGFFPFLSLFKSFDLQNPDNRRRDYADGPIPTDKRLQSPLPSAEQGGKQHGPVLQTRILVLYLILQNNAILNFLRVHLHEIHLQ